MFTPARLLDPLRIVRGTGDVRYDCPDVAALDRHIDRLRRRIAVLHDEAPGTTGRCRADIDRLLDRRFWLTLPVAPGRQATHQRAEPVGAHLDRGGTVSRSETEKTTGSYLEALSSRGDFGRFFTDTVTIEVPGSPTIPRITGHDAVEEFIRDFHGKAFEAGVSVRRVLAGDGGSTAELVFEGVHSGEFAGIPATGKRVSLPYCAAYDFTGGAISAIRIYMPIAELVAQIRS